MRAIATYAGRDASTSLLCVEQYTQKCLRIRRRWNETHKCTSVCTDQQIHRKIRRESYTTAFDFRIRLRSSANVCVSNQFIHKRMLAARLHAWQTGTGIPLSARHRAARLTWCSHYHNSSNQRHCYCSRRSPTMNPAFGFAVIMDLY